MIAGSLLRNAWIRRDRKDQTFEPDLWQIAGFSQTSVYAIRIRGALVQPHEADDIAERMRERLAQRGELGADIVVVQGDTKNSLRLFGTPYSVNRVRTSMFNAAIRWMPLDLG